VPRLSSLCILAAEAQGGGASCGDDGPATWRDHPAGGEAGGHAERGLETFGLPPAWERCWWRSSCSCPRALGRLRGAVQPGSALDKHSLGSALATLAMTVPAVIIIAMAGNTTLELGLPPYAQVMLVLTFFTSMLTFGSGRTNVLQGNGAPRSLLAFLLISFPENRSRGFPRRRQPPNERQRLPDRHRQHRIGPLS